MRMCKDFLGVHRNCTGVGGIIMMKNQVEKNMEHEIGTGNI